MDARRDHPSSAASRTPARLRILGKVDTATQRAADATKQSAARQDGLAVGGRVIQCQHLLSQDSASWRDGEHRRRGRRRYHLAQDLPQGRSCLTEYERRERHRNRPEPRRHRWRYRQRGPQKTRCLSTRAQKLETNGYGRGRSRKQRVASTGTATLGERLRARMHGCPHVLRPQAYEQNAYMQRVRMPLSKGLHIHMHEQACLPMALHMEAARDDGVDAPTPTNVLTSSQVGEQSSSSSPHGGQLCACRRRLREQLLPEPRPRPGRLDKF